MNTKNSTCLGKALTFLAFALIAVAPLLAAQSEHTDWEAKAMQEFPELGIAGSAFNRAFLENVAMLKRRNPSFFGDPAWSYQLASQISKLPEFASSVSAAAASPRVVAAHPSPVGVPQIRSRRIAQRCVAAIEQKLLESPDTDKLSMWLVDGRVLAPMRVRALLLAKKLDPGFQQELAGFLNQILEFSGSNSQEDTAWLKAFLCAVPLHASTASSLDAEVHVLMAKFLSESNDEDFVVSWLAGKPSQTDFDSASAAPKDVRFGVLDLAVRDRCRLGQLQLSKSSIVDILIKDCTPDAYTMLREFSLRDWPMLYLRHSGVPQGKFNPKTKDWQDYEKSITAIHHSLKANKLLPVPSVVKPLQPGFLETYILWTSTRHENPQETFKYLEEALAQIKTYPHASVREMEKVFPALAFHFQNFKN